MRIRELTVRSSEPGWEVQLDYKMAKHTYQLVSKKFSTEHDAQVALVLLRVIFDIWRYDHDI